MNILPKKRWHVRTKDNIARVRRDEAKAAEEEKDKLARVHKAEQEARLNFLRKKNRENTTEEFSNENQIVPVKQSIDEDNTLNTEQEISERLNQKNHINFFSEVEDGKNEHSKPNKDHEHEIKEEKEKYEKQIGYLTYLGQDTNEALGKRNWYDVLPERLTGKSRPEHVKNTYDRLIIKDIEGNVKPKEIYEELQTKWKTAHDPLNIINFHLKKDEKKEIASHSKHIDETKSLKRKLHVDPVEYSSVLPKRSKKEMKKKLKHKKEKKHKKKRKQRESISVEVSEEEKQSKLEILRRERLKREQEEKDRADALIARVTGKPIPNKSNASTSPMTRVVKQKYNSQFNPEIAKQNFDKYQY
ncbi:leukocyte receptor cluster member 1 homolog [Arctopsyche grandis]|uniref:leukocyte receptor cluster member 1 homolog n=1 Tax=Arctopsyche grandis TaxID=121162 RepID=UPI00406D6C34